MSKYQFIEDKVAQLKADGLYRLLPVSTTATGNRITVGNQELINLSSNNYLGLLNHPRLIQKAHEALDHYGVGAGSVRTIVGNHDLLETLEERLATFKEEEAVVCFQSGLNCNIGTIQAIVERGDLILSDELNHASIIDGVRLSKADKAVYKHNDMVDLRRLLEEKRQRYKTVLIITDAVFSMDGDLASLPDIVALAEEFDALTYVDDAHGSGVLGRSGRGTIDHFGLHGRVDFIVGTLSKAIGVIGGYVATKKIIKEWLLHRARPLLFSTALPPSATAATLAAVELLMESDETTQALWRNAAYFKAGLTALGFDIGASQTPITPVMLGDETLTMTFSKDLMREGVFVSGIVYPTVGLGKGRCRVMLSAAHTQDDLDTALRAFERVGKHHGVIV